MFFSDIGHIFGQLLIEVVLINISLMLFNLLPVPPLDGFGVLCDIFNLYGTPFYYAVMKNSMIILMLLIIFHVPSMLISSLLWRIAGFIMSTVYGLGGWYLLL
jgi:Zn-dependent protease